MLEQDPTISSRAITERLKGKVSGRYVDVVREKWQLRTNCAVEQRTGRDGKKRRMPTKSPAAGARIATTKKGARRVRMPPSGVPITQQLNNLTWQLDKFREDWERTVLDFYQQHPEYCASLSRCAASNALALTQLAEALQDKQGCADVETMELAA